MWTFQIAFTDFTELSICSHTRILIIKNSHVIDVLAQTHSKGLNLPGELFSVSDNFLNINKCEESEIRDDYWIITHSPIVWVISLLNKTVVVKYWKSISSIHKEWIQTIYFYA